MTVTRTQTGPWYRGSADVTVVDQNNQPVANATVSGVFSPGGGSQSGVTGANGMATVTSDKTRTPPANWCFQVDSVTLSGATYNSGANVWTVRCENGSGSAAGGLDISSRDAEISSGILMGSRPNPLRSSTVIGFRVPDGGHVRLEIFDVSGRRVAVLADRPFAAGEHGLTWDASFETAGIYFCRLSIGDTVETRKLMVVK